MPKVFISYSHKDKRHLDRLQEQLAAIDRHQPISVKIASDQDLRAGDLWEQRIESLMSGADAVVFLVSAPFLASEMCANELEYAMKDHRRPMLVALVGASNADMVPGLARSQFLNGARVIGVKDWARVAKEIYTIVLGPSDPPEEEPRAETPPTPVQLLRDAVKDGRFTPVLGPGCYQLPENQRRGFDLVRARIDAIAEACTGGERSRSYLEGVVSSKMPNILRHEQAPRRYSATPVGLLELQSSLADLGAASCLHMSAAMRDESRGFTRVRSLSTPISANAAVELRSCFFAATDHAFNLMKGATENLRDLGLGGRGIFDTLIALTYVVFHSHLSGPSREPQVDEWSDRYPANLRNASGLVQRDQPIGTLSFAQVEWIGNLLWHTIRFDVPMYPTLEELAFQLSLCMPDPMLPRRERATAMAELADWSSRAELIPKWYRRYAPTSYADSDHGFYDSLVTALIAPPARTPRKLMRGSFMEGSEQLLNSVPVAITTNLDNELEGSLERLRKPYEVVCPVWLVKKKRSSVTEHFQDWLLRTVTPDCEGTYRVKEWLLGRRGLDDPEIASALVGPLIVKLHGSPLHPLPDPADLVGGCPSHEGTSCALQHRFTLSDSDFVNAIILRDRFRPPGLQRLFKTGRLLCFLGLPLSDLYSRFALYDYLGSEVPGIHLVLMDSPRDPVRHRLLSEIKVGLVEADFELLVNHLKEWLPSSELVAGGRR